MSLELKKPLADHAPKTYRRLNPRALEVMSGELVQLAGRNEGRRDVSLLVAEYVIEQVRSADEQITGIEPENFVAAILARSGVAQSVTYPLTETGKALPIVTIEREQYIVDFSSVPPLQPLELWLR